jgi:hypothetical protein
MDEQFKNIFKFLKSERLTDNERIAMRNVLRSVMAENPMQTAGGMPSRYEGILSYFNSASLRPVGFALVFVIVAGVGASYAAESALPGDPLYALKVSVNEPVQGVLAVSPVAKAEWDTELISRRLEEAATLASQGNLSSEARNAIEVQIEQKAESVSKNVAKLRASDEGVVAAATVESDLEASLVGHEHVLTSLSIDLPEQAPSIAPLLHKVRMQSEATNMKRKSAERDISEKGEDTVRKAATNRKRDAENGARKIRAFANAKQLAASTTVEASTSAAHIENAIEDGERKFREGKYSEALVTFQATVRAAKAVEVNIEADERLRGDVEAKLTELERADPTNGGH